MNIIIDIVAWWILTSIVIGVTLILYDEQLHSPDLSKEDAELIRRRIAKMAIQGASIAAMFVTLRKLATNH